MRRPSPLPPPTAGSATAGAVPDPRESEAVPESAAYAAAYAEAPDDGAATPASADTAPVTPIASPSPLQRPAPLPAALGTPAQSTDEEAPGADATPEVGIREVWRAARARRKALRAEVRRFTVRQRRRRAAWLGAAASVVVLVLATLGAAYSPLFALETITVDGAAQLDAADVEAALSDQLGTPLPLVDESAVKAALVTFPLVESYTLEARPPHELVVRIVERLPIGVIETRAGFTLVDAAGVVLSTSQTPPPGAPLLTIAGGTSSRAFDSVGRVMRTLPESIRAQVTAVTASTADDVTLTLGGTDTQVVWGSADESALKAVALQTIMAARPPAEVSVYDVSSPRAVVVG